jgi:hypothetical protein
VGIILLVLVFAFTRRVHAWKIRRAYARIVQDLERKGALDPSSAADLPYAKRGMLRVGLRDYRPQTIKFMIEGKIIGVTESGRYYLKNKDVGDQIFQ